MNQNRLIKIWMRERDAAVRTQDVETFKAFYLKWARRGIYDMHMPADKVIEISMRKMLYHMASATEAEKAEAKTWLETHGSTDL